MTLTALTRAVSPSIGRCELTYHDRAPIDFARAQRQHKAYEDCLTDLGVQVISLPAQDDYPDSVFVEDAAIVLDEVAIIPIMGAPSRRGEATSLAAVLSEHRPLKYLVEPATLDGGDVITVGRRLFIGLTQRTNQDAINQVRKILRPFDYTVESVEVTNILHLKSACSYTGQNTLLINRSLVDDDVFRGFQLLDVPEVEPAAPNALLIDDNVIIAASFPQTREVLKQRGFRVLTVDVSELQKAEAGITCCSLIFQSGTTRGR